MSEKMVTEREARIRERRAFVEASSWETRAWQETLGVNHCSGADSIAESRRRYPLPKRIAPRIVHIADDEQPRDWRVIDGNLEHRDEESDWEWESADDYWWDLDPDSIRALADLIASPTIEVDDDGTP